jgi:hypothetical protein
VSQRYHSSLHDFDKVNYLPRTPSGPQVAQDRPRAGLAHDRAADRALRLGPSGRGSLGRDRLDQGCRRKALF